MRMNQIIEFLNIYPQIKNNKIKISVAYKLSKCFEYCEQEAKFYTTKLNEILGKYGQKDESGALIQDEKTQSVLIVTVLKNECENELTELLNLEVYFDEQLKINVNDIENFELNMESFRKLKPFLQD